MSRCRRTFTIVRQRKGRQIIDMQSHVKSWYRETRVQLKSVNANGRKKLITYLLYDNDDATMGYAKEKIAISLLKYKSLRLASINTVANSFFSLIISPHPKNISLGKKPAPYPANNTNPIPKTSIRHTATTTSERAPQSSLPSTIITRSNGTPLTAQLLLCHHHWY